MSELPCHNCIKADSAPDGRPMMCRKVSNIVLGVLQTGYSLDISADARLEPQIAASKLGKYPLADAAAEAACVQIPLPPPAHALSILEIIQC